MNSQSNANSPAKQLPKRRLSILRHAKAEEGDGDDVARSLNERGVQDALKIGDFIKKKNVLPELVICSTAQRTRQTLAQLQVMVPTILASRAYLASAGEWMTLVKESDDAVQHILLVGHNPGLHQLVATLAARYANDEDAALIADKYPTCTFASLSLPIRHWSELAPHDGTLDVLAVGSRL